LSDQRTTDRVYRILKEAERLLVGGRVLLNELVEATEFLQIVDQTMLLHIHIKSGASLVQSPLQSTERIVSRGFHCRLFMLVVKGIVGLGIAGGLSSEVGVHLLNAGSLHFVQKE